MIKYINDNNFKTLGGAKAYLLYFYSEGCRPCQMTSPEVEAFAEDNAELTVGKAETSVSAELCDRFRIRSVPTIVFVKDGEETARLSGRCSRGEISKAVFGEPAVRS